MPVAYDTKHRTNGAGGVNADALVVVLNRLQKTIRKDQATKNTPQLDEKLQTNMQLNYSICL